MLLRCWDLWYRLLRYIHVATLLRSLGSCTTLHTCCYAAEISGIVYYVTYMLLRCWDLWDRLLRYIHVATLLRSLVSFTTLHVATLLRSLGSFTTLHVATLLRSLGSFTTLHVATLLRSLGSFTTLHVATLLRSLGSFTTLHTCCYAAEISEVSESLAMEMHSQECWLPAVYYACVAAMTLKSEKNAPQVFPGFPIIKLTRHCGKITFFFF